MPSYISPTAPGVDGVIHGSRGVIDIPAGLPGAVTERFSALATPKR